MKRYVRVDGVPSKIEAIFVQAPPRKLYEVLFRELCQIDIYPMTITYQYGEPREGQIAHGYFGTEHTGIRWTEGYSTMTPMYVSDVSYGLPQLQLYWQYQWSSGGHAPSMYHHSQLEVAFDDELVLKHFIQIWLNVFGQAPILTDLNPESAENLEKRLIHKNYDVVSADFKFAMTNSSETIPKLLTLPAEMGFLFQLAANPNTPSLMLQALWRHPQVVDTREAVKRSPYGSAAPFFGSDEDFLERLEFAIAGHRNTPQDMLAALAQSKNTHFIQTVKRNPSFLPQDESTSKECD